MSGIYFITIRISQPNIPIIFRGSFVVDYDQSPNVVAFYEDGNPNNILAPVNSYGENNNLFISRSYPFDPFGTNITYMTYYSTNYGESTDSTYNLYALYDDAYTNTSEQTIGNFPNQYLFSVSGGPVYPPFPLDTSIPPASFYTIQGLSMFLNQNTQYKTYYTNVPQFPYLSAFAESIYSLESSTMYNYEDVPLGPLLSNMNQSQLLTYQKQLELFREVYTHNSNAYITYVSNPNAKGPIYYTFQTYKELNNYKAGLQLVNRLYPFDIMADAYTFNTGVPLRWIVPFPM